MRFGPNVVEHAPFSIPMIGNTATGYSIGLTPEGAAVCLSLIHIYLERLYHGGP